MKLMMLTKIIFFIWTISFFVFPQSKILIYMDLHQTDHLKAYGITFRALIEGIKADWLLNYRGGSFLIDNSDKIATECRIEGVSFDVISSSEAVNIYAEVQSEDNNMDVV
ncbi:MAG: asparagine synthetase B, partial [Ignavibacteriales bacterium]